MVLIHLGISEGSMHSLKSSCCTISQASTGSQTNQPARLHHTSLRLATRAEAEVTLSRMSFRISRLARRRSMELTADRLLRNNGFKATLSHYFRIATP